MNIEPRCVEVHVLSCNVLGPEIEKFGFVQRTRDGMLHFEALYNRPCVQEMITIR